MLEIEEKTSESENFEEAVIAVFNLLPQDLKRVATDATIMSKIVEIAKQFTLTEGQTIFLKNEVIQVILTIFTKEEFGARIKNEFGKDIGDGLFKKIEEKIFSGIDKLISSTQTRPEPTLSLEINKSISSIGEKNGLRVDELGILEEAIRKRVDGKESVSTLKDEIRRKLNLGSEELEKLIEDINNEILNPIRENLKNLPPRNEEPIPSKEDILSELEDRADAPLKPENQRAEAEKSFLSGNIMVEEKVLPAKPTEKETIPKPSFNIFEEKLNKPITIETKKVETGVPRESGQDPYREPIN